MKTILSLLLLIPILIFSQEKCLTKNDISSLRHKNLDEIHFLMKIKEWKSEGELPVSTHTFKGLEYDNIHKWSKKTKSDEVEFLIVREGNLLNAVVLKFKGENNSCEKSFYAAIDFDPKSMKSITIAANDDYTIDFLRNDVKNQREFTIQYIPEILTIAIQPNENSEPSPIVEYPEVEASFPGGTQEMMKYFYENMEYPAASKELREQGRVFVEFVVNKDGSIDRIKILRGVSNDINAEVLRLVKAMPNWIPAQSNGENINARARIPINFVLPVEEK